MFLYVDTTAAQVWEGLSLLSPQALADRLGERVQFTVEAMAALMLYPWPEDEEELWRELTVASRQAAGKPITLELLPWAVRRHLPPPPPASLIDRLTGEAEKQFLDWAVRQGLPKMTLAHRLGITRSALYKKMHRHGIALELDED